MPKLTKNLIRNLEPKAAKYFIWDEGSRAVAGLGVAVYPAGTKTFVFQYRNQHNKTRRYTLGKSAKMLTLDEARQLAKNLAAEVRAGKDPQAERRKRREALTVNDLLDEYLASEKFAAKAETTRKTDRGRLDRHIRPLLGHQIVESLTAEDVLRARKAIATGKTATDERTGPRGRAIVRGGEGAARMACRVLRAIFAWGESEKLIPNNPAAGLSFGSDGEREQILRPEDYPRLFRTLEALEEQRRIRRPVADAIRVLALTGCRRGEITGLRWRWVDLRRGLIELPAKAHKTGHKSGKAKTINLPSAAQAVVARQPQGSPDSLVFESAKGNGVPLALSKPWRLVRQEAGLPEGIGLHGLRHSIGSLMAVQGAQAAQIAETLGHTQLSTTKRYLHFGDQDRAAVIERHTSGIAAALEGREAGEVVDLRKEGVNRG